ncbi:hypothetical protein GBAR_LOCUS22964, partial [Geodia barretti]
MGNCWKKYDSVPPEVADLVLGLLREEKQEDCQTLRTSSHSERKETVLNHHSGSVEERTRHGSDRSG